MTARLHNYLILFCLVLLLTSCAANKQESAEPELSSTSLPTRVVVRILDLSAFNNPLPSETRPAELPTATLVLLPTATPAAIHTGEPAQTRQPSPTQCLNRAEFVKNLTISENTALKAGQVFSKIWRIKNTGTCTWSAGYSLQFFSGEKMGGPANVNLPGIVAPGEMVDIRINLTAPSEQAAHTGSWVLSDPHGNLFGIGQDGNLPLTVVIQVKPTPRPTPG